MTEVKYNIGDGREIIAEYDDNGIMEITRECFEGLIGKQIPRGLTSIRKVKQYDGYDMGNCPICGEPLDNSFYENLKYCFVCGQKIDWGNEDDRD